MKIDYLFGKNKKIGSRLISWAAKLEFPDMDNPPSHVALLIGERIVVESKISSGIRLIPYSKWLEEYEQVERINTRMAHMKVWEVLSQVWGKKYDKLGILYFALRYLLLLVAKIPLPTTNKWENNNRYFCTEFIGRLSGKKYSMVSPTKLMRMIQEKE